MNADVIRFRLRDCWLNPENLRMSCEQPGVHGFTLHALVLEWVEVAESHRQQGHFKRFVEQLCADERFEMVVVEAVQNPILAEALLRWGWDCDSGVMDFYRWKR